MNQIVSKKDFFDFHELPTQIIGKTTFSIIIIDRSESMGAYMPTPVEAVDAHLRALNEGDGNTQQLCMVVSFSNEAKVELGPVRVSKKTEVKMTGYAPYGMTLLYQTVDEVLSGILAVMKAMPKEILKDLLVVVGVFSDGNDNQSDTEVYPQKLQKRAKRCLDQGIKLMTFGIGMDGEKLAGNMGFPTDKKSAKTVEASKKGIEEASLHFTHITQSLRF